MAERVLITGVSSGLGHGLAQVFLERGAEVRGCSRRAPEDLIGRGLIFAEVDLGDPDAGASAFERLLEDAGSLDLAVLNAGKLGQIRDMRDTPLEDLRETMEINVWANKWILDAIFARMSRVGQVVAISSGAARSGSRGWNGYSISKAALNMFVQVYAGERPETHFTSLAPGLVDTAMQEYLTNLPEDDRFPPLKRLKEAKGTHAMPDAEACARHLAGIFPKLRHYASGAFVDVRDMEA